MSDEKPSIPPFTSPRLSDREPKSSVNDPTNWRNPGTPKGGKDKDEQEREEREKFFEDFDPEDFKPI